MDAEVEDVMIETGVMTSSRSEEWDGRRIGVCGYRYRLSALLLYHRAWLQGAYA